MKNIINLKLDNESYPESAKKITTAFEKGNWVQLISSKDKEDPISDSNFPKGPGIIINSGGSTGGIKKCLLKDTNLNQSAISTAEFLKKIEIKPKDCLLINPLPMHHISGFMPWWRSQLWGAKHVWIKPSVMRNIGELEKTFEQYEINKSHKLIISLVPTQLKRLLSNKATIKLLKEFDLIWVGGAGLSDKMANFARECELRLAPCYGSTETTAMVTALKPNDFLSGANGCGEPLTDVELSIAENGALKIRTNRLAYAAWEKNQLKPITDKNGWWEPEDLASLCEQFVYDHDGALNATLKFALDFGIEITPIEVKEFITQMHKDGDFDDVECWGLELGANDLYKKFHPEND